MRSYYLAKSLMAHDHVVTVVCASNHHLRTHPAEPQDCTTLRNYGDVRYYQLPTRSYVGNGKNRLFNMLDFGKNFRAMGEKVASGSLEPPDVLIASSPHLFVFPAARRLAKGLGAKLIFEVRDIWPLSLVHLAGISAWHPLVLWLGFIERQAYRKADAVVSPLPKAHLHMVKKGMAVEKFYCVPNGINLEDFKINETTLPEEHQALFDGIRAENKKIVLYAGSQGPPNALEQILDLAKISGNETAPYHFVLLGDGASKHSLVERVAREKISFVSFLPRVSQEQALKAISSADICFLGWQEKDIYQYGVSPNKLGDYLMSGKPVVHAIAGANDLVAESGAGISVKPYNAEQLDVALRKLCSLSVGEREGLGELGRKYVVENLDWKVLGGKYSEVISSLL
ncbi:MAG: glycosyltransferase family 4 protein [Spirochaetales bacterium]|nr:glycosyltransferase family 4 protein [Spirochaetales bacterium]